MLPGLVRYDEVARGHIDHALRFTVENTRRAFIYPARHFASDQTDPNLPPMGLRVRLRAGFNTSGYPRPVRVILEALKRYGMIVADNGAELVHLRRPRPALERRRPARDQQGHGRRLRGGRHLEPALRLAAALL